MIIDDSTTDEIPHEQSGHSEAHNKALWSPAEQIDDDEDYSEVKLEECVDDE